MRFTKLTSVLVLALSSAAGFSQITTCTPNWATGGQTCTTQPDPTQQYQEQQREQQRQWQEQQRQQQEQWQHQREYDEQRQQSLHGQCTTYHRDPLSGQLQARTGPCF